MIHDLRREERFPLNGEAVLRAGEDTLSCEVVDVSMGGISIAIRPEQEAMLHGHRAWRCHLESPDLPAPLDCLVRVVRQRPLIEGRALGCQIAAIDTEGQRFLKAYKRLAIARSNPLMWHRRSEPVGGE